MNTLLWTCWRWAGHYAAIHHTHARLDQTAATPPVDPGEWSAKPRHLCAVVYDRMNDAAGWLWQQMRGAAATQARWQVNTVDIREPYARICRQLRGSRAGQWTGTIPGGLAIVVAVVPQLNQHAMSLEDECDH